MVVYTSPEFRYKGFGKKLVIEASKWCFRNGLLPIYLVECNNNASINLAKNVGFVNQSEEIIVSTVLRTEKTS